MLANLHNNEANAFMGTIRNTPVANTIATSTVRNIGELHCYPRKSEEIHVNSKLKGQEINPLTVFSQLGRWMAKLSVACITNFR